MSDLIFVASDDAPSVFGTLATTAGPVNLTGATVKFQMRLADNRRFAVNAAAVVVTPTTGAVRYDWAPGDLATPGDYVSRWRVTFGDGTIQHSEPENTITVESE